MGCSHVRCRHGDTLAADQLEKTVSLMVQRHADLGDCYCSLHRNRGDLSVRDGGCTTIHLFPILI